MPTKTSTTEEARRIGLRYLLANPGNARGPVDPGDPRIAELAASIDQHGLLEPLVVIPDAGNEAGNEAEWRYLIVAGHRRLAALKTLPSDRRVVSDGVLCIVRSDMTAESPKLAAAALVENLQRVDLLPMEEARAFAALRDDHQWAQQRIAESIGRNPGHVSKRLSLLKLLPELAKLVDTGELVLEQALEAAKLPKAGQDAMLAEHHRGLPWDQAITRARVRAEQLADRVKLAKDLKAAGVPTVDGADGQMVKGATQVGSALWWLSPLPAAHADCPRRLVYLGAEPRRGAEPGFATWATEFCTYDDPIAAHPRDTSGDGDAQVEPDDDGISVPTELDPTAPGGPEDAAGVADHEEREQHRTDVGNAASARERFVRALLAGKLPKSTADHLSRQLVLETVAGAGVLEDAPDVVAAAADLLGNVDANEDGHAVMAAADMVDLRSMGDALTRWALAIRLAVDESCGDAFAMRWHGDDAAELLFASHVRWLISVGYDASSVEQAFLEAAGLHPTRAYAEDVYGIPGGIPVPADPEPDEVEIATAEAAGDVDEPQHPLDDDPPHTYVPDPPAEPEPVTAVLQDYDDPTDEQLTAARAEPLPDDLHTYKREQLVQLAKRRGVETTPRMTKLQIRAAIEQDAKS